jgi:two-component system chemotaxis sensor kinase CheA
MTERGDADDAGPRGVADAGTSEPTSRSAPAATPAAPELDMELLRRVFYAEAEEHTGELEQALLTLEDAPDNRDAVRNAFRSIHTIKGSAASVGYDHVADFAHRVENVMERLRDGALSVTPRMIGLLLQSVDALREMIAGGANGLQRASALRPALAEVALEATGWAVSRAGTSPLGRAGAPERRTPEPHGTPPSSEREASPGDASAPVSRRGAAGGRGATLRVGIEKLDRLLDLAGEIVIARASVESLLREVAGVMGQRLREAYRDADRLIFELQEQVSSVRMVQIGPVLRQYVRIARDVANALGRRVRVEIEGEDVELDAAVIEHLKDPLTHIVRNAVDHGIEPPSEREAGGKPVVGCITFRCSHDAGSILIECSDDGRGLDAARILERARARGLVGADAPQTEAAIFRLLFEEGFSTAEQVNAYSGRGVGMDVVRTNVESAGGSVALTGRPGEGMTVSIRLPLTLAILDALCVSAAGETFLIPLAAVVECLDLGSAARRERTGLLWRRDRHIPWARLSDAIGAARDDAPCAELVVVAHDDQLLGLAVDKVHGTQQIVIKPLHRLFREAPGVAGCTILSSGRVALVLDVSGLRDLAVAVSARARGALRRGVTDVTEVEATA